MFGGTFDTVHQGHLDLARHVLQRCRLDQVVFIPAPHPPHKRRPTASFADRVAMLEASLAAAGAGERMCCSRIEASLPSPSYTVHTVEAIAQLSGPCDLFLIIGADSLLDLPHWHRAADLLAAVNLIVVQRHSLDQAEITRVLKTVDATYHFDALHGRWRNLRERSVLYLDDLELPVSSSLIRERLAQGEVPSMLPSVVFAYIRRHHLYGWQEHA